MAVIVQRAMKRLLSPACALAALVAQATAVSSLRWDFAKTEEDRAFVDVKPTPSRPGVPAGAIALDIKLFEGAASVRAATFHLKIGGDWLAAAQVDTAALATSRLRVPFGNFAPTVGEEPKIDEVRVSVWRSPSPGAGRLVVNSLSLAPVSEIAVLSGPAGSWMETLARRVAATLSRSRLDCDLHPSVSAAVKSAPRLVIVPDASSLSADDAEPKEPVKKEHDPVEIIGEPFLVYDHFVKGNSDLVNKNAGEADETADRPVTAVVAGQDGYVAASAGKDSTIQLWYTYDFYAEILAEMYGYSYDYDYDPTIGTGQASPNQPNAQEGNARAGNTKAGQAAGRQQNARQGNNADRDSADRTGAANRRGADQTQGAARQAAGTRPGQTQAGATAAARRSQNAAMRQTDPFRQQQTAGVGTRNNPAYYSNTAEGYDDSYAFYSSRQGNLRVQIPTRDALKEQIAAEGGKDKKNSGKNSDWFGGDPQQGWSKSSKKTRKPPTTLGKMFTIYERLNLMGEREGQGYSDMMSFTHDLPGGSQDVFYTSDYSGKVCQLNLGYKKGKGFPYARKRGVKNTMWAVAVYPGYTFDYKNGVYRDLVAGANNNGNIYFWDAFSRKLLRAVTVSASDDPKTKPVLDINFAPDCSVVTAGMDGCARVITVPAMQIVSLLKGHKGPIFSAVFDETGQYVLTGSKDKSACLWDTTSGEVIAAFIGHTGAVRKVQFLTDRYILTCSDDKTARIWELPDEVSLSLSSEPEYSLDEFGNPVDEEGNPVDISAKAGAGWGTSAGSIEDELFAVDEEDDEKADGDSKGKNAGGEDEEGEEEEDPAGTRVDAQGANEDEVPEQSIADAPRGYEVFRFEGPSPVFSMSINDY